MFLKSLVIVLCVWGVNSLAVKKAGHDSSEEETKTKVLKSVEEFVKYVDTHKLNVSIISTQSTYDKTGSLTDEMTLNIHMPSNDVYLTQTTLDDEKLNKYLTNMKKLALKDKAGLQTKVIQIKDGKIHEEHKNSMNKKYVLSFNELELPVNYKYGFKDYEIPSNETNEILYHYVITDSKDKYKTIDVIKADVVVEEMEKSKDFPLDTLKELKQILPRLWIPIEDTMTLARLVVEHLDKTFGRNHQAMIGVDTFALGGKAFAKVKVGNTNVLVFF